MVQERAGEGCLGLTAAWICKAAEAGEIAAGEWVEKPGADQEVTLQE